MDKDNINKIVKVFNKLGKGTKEKQYYICVWNHIKQYDRYCTYTLESKNLDEICVTCIKLRNKLNGR